MEWKENESGLVVPKDEAGSEVQSIAPEFPSVKGWGYSRCDGRHELAKDGPEVKAALELLYIQICGPGGGGIFESIRGIKPTRMQELERMIDELATELVGGKPDGYEEWT